MRRGPWTVAAMAAAAGACGAVLAYAALCTFLYGVFRNWTFFDTGPDKSDPVGMFLAFAVAPALAVGGGSILALALGAGGWRAPLVSLAAFALGVPTSIPLMALMSYFHPLIGDGYLAFPAAFTPAWAVAAPVLVSLLALRDRSPVRWRGMVASCALASVLLAAIVLLPYAGAKVAAGVALWTLVPVVATIGHRR